MSILEVLGALFLAIVLIVALGFASGILSVGFSFVWKRK